MNKVKIPDSLSAASWSAVKGDVAKDKALSKIDGAKLAAAAGALDSAYADFSGLDGLTDTKGLTAATAAGAVDKFDKAANPVVKAIANAASSAGKAAGDVAAAADKAAKEKGASKETIKTATSLKNTFASGPKDATSFASAISSAVDAARKELEDAVKAIVNKATEKKPPAPAPVKANPKALADAKFLSALARKSIALLRTPKGSPMPIKFLVLFNKANPKDLKLYLGPKPESGLAKLKTQFPPDVKVNRVKDPKGRVVWDKGALTFLSDILKSGLAKQIQLAIKASTKVTVKVRIKRSDGAVDEADAKEVSDDELKISPAEEAEMSDWKKTLDGLAADIKNAPGPNGDKIRKMAASAKSADDVEKIEELLGESDIADSDGKDLQADAEEKKDAIAELKEKLNAIPAKVTANKGLKKEAAAVIGTLQKAGIAELGKAKPSLDSAKKALDKIESLLDAASVSTFPAAAVEKARKEWADSRAAAIKGITDLSKKINEAFKAETSQKDAVIEALKKLGTLQIKLQTGLDNELNLAIKSKDPEKQADMVDRARDSLSSLRDFMKGDELIQNLDNHGIPGVPNLTVVNKMMTSLDKLEKALPTH